MGSGTESGKHNVGGCTGKIGYLRRDAAMYEAQRIADLNKERMSVYRCAQCREYHVGSNANGEILPNTVTLPEGENEREHIVERVAGINAALEEIRYGNVDRSWEKKRRLIAEKKALEVRLAQIKRLRKEAHNVRIRENLSRRRAEEGGTG